jgi:glycosyltransferase involved in cell wall biosynthesis
MSQAYSSFEIIIVDDCSTDETVSFLESHYSKSVTILKHTTNTGAAAARNTGIANAKGRYVAFLDSDDVWLPTKLEKQIALIEQTKVAIVGSQSAFFDISNQTLKAEWYPTYIPAASKILIDNLHINTSTLLIDRTLISEDKNWFDTSLKCFEDWDLLLTIGSNQDIRTIADLAVISFTSNDGLSSVTQAHNKYYALAELCRRHKKLMEKNPPAYQRLLHYTGRLAQQSDRTKDASNYYLRAIQQNIFSLQSIKSTLRLFNNLLH